MPIADNTKVAIHYTLKDDSGNVIDSSVGKEPLSYVQGRGMIVVGLEKALAGKEVGDKFSVEVSPAEGYGERNPELVRSIPRNAFQAEEIRPGMTFYANTPAGAVPLTVTKVEEENVTVDMNHELAGKTLHFEIEVMGAAPLSDAEIQELDAPHEHHCCHGEGHPDEDGEHHCCGKHKHEGEHHCCHGEGHSGEDGEHHCRCKEDKA